MLLLAQDERFRLGSPLVDPIIGFSGFAINNSCPGSSRLSFLLDIVSASSLFSMLRSPFSNLLEPGGGSLRSLPCIGRQGVPSHGYPARVSGMWQETRAAGCDGGADGALSGLQYGVQRPRLRSYRRKAHGRAATAHGRSPADSAARSTR